MTPLPPTRATALALLFALPLALPLAATAQTPDVATLVHNGQFAQAEQLLNEQSMQAPRDAQLVVQRAMLLSLQKRDAQAIRLLDNLLERQPSLPAAYHVTALIHMQSGELEAAKVAAQRALRVDSDYSPALQTLGVIEARLARQAFDRAWRLNSSDPVLRQKLDALADVIGSTVASPFVQPGALVALAPPGLAPAATAVAVAATVTPAVTSTAPAAAPGRVLMPTPHGIAPTAAAATLHSNEAGATPTFATVAGGANAPTGFFGVPRLVVPADLGSTVTAERAATLGVPASAARNGLTATMALAGMKAAPAAKLAVVASADKTSDKAADKDAAKAAAKPAVAQTVAAAPAAANPAARAEVETALRQWAAAWSRRDMGAYLTAYAADFTGNARSHEAWERDRRQRIATRTKIIVELSDVVISVNGDRAEVRFRQRYESDSVNSTDRKLLQWQRAPSGGWLIRKETVES